MINYERRAKFAQMKIAALRLQANRTVTEKELTMNAREKVRAHPLYDSIETAVLELWVDIREELEKGLTIAGVWRVVEETTVNVLGILADIEASNVDKKELTILLLEDLYENEIKPLDLPWIPNTIEDFVDQTIGQALRPVVSWLIDKAMGK